jgi:hypothetical protein
MAPAHGMSVLTQVDQDTHSALNLRASRSQTSLNRCHLSGRPPPRRPTSPVGLRAFVSHRNQDAHTALESPGGWASACIAQAKEPPGGITSTRE